jgi:hypothetical protein
LSFQCEKKRRYVIACAIIKINGTKVSVREKPDCPPRAFNVPMLQHVILPGAPEVRRHEADRQKETDAAEIVLLFDNAAISGTGSTHLATHLIEIVNNKDPAASMTSQIFVLIQFLPTSLLDDFAKRALSKSASYVDYTLRTRTLAVRVHIFDDWDFFESSPRVYDLFPFDGMKIGKNECTCNIAESQYIKTPAMLLFIAFYDESRSHCDCVACCANSRPAYIFSYHS